MVFTPPPSPLPSRHSFPISPQAEDDDSDDSASTSSSQYLTVPSFHRSSSPRRPQLRTPPQQDMLFSSNPRKYPIPAPVTSSRPSSSSHYLLSTPFRRKLLVLLVPTMLLLIGSLSSFLHNYDSFASPFISMARYSPSLGGGAFPGILRDLDLVSTPAPLAMPHSPGSPLDSLSRHLRSARRYNGYAIEKRDTAFLDERAEDDEDEVAPATSPSPTPTSTIDHSEDAFLPPIPENEASQTAPAIPSTPWPLPTPFPQPFDSTIGYNFSSATCLAFFENQLANETLRSCRPFGLLFGSSSDFFQIEGNLTELTAVLEGTCSTTTSEDTCVNVMDWMASQMILPTVCRQDLSEKNSIALEALYGFRSYLIMQKVGCLVNPRTNAYCFAEALAQTSPSDLYYYAIPLGTPVPGTVPTTTKPQSGASGSDSAPAPATTFAPSCSSCTAALMAIFAPSASDPSLLLGETYPPAAKAANGQCGAGYAPGPESVVATPTPPVPANGAKSAAVRRIVGGGGGVWGVGFVSVVVTLMSSLGVFCLAL